MKQTAVEYLFGELWNTNKDKLHWHTFLEVAKEIEKEQIIDALSQGQMTNIDYNPEQYYKETYGE